MTEYEVKVWERVLNLLENTNLSAVSIAKNADCTYHLVMKLAKLNDYDLNFRQKRIKLYSYIGNVKLSPEDELTAIQIVETNRRLSNLHEQYGEHRINSLAELIDVDLEERERRIIYANKNPDKRGYPRSWRWVKSLAPKDAVESETSSYEPRIWIDGTLSGDDRCLTCLKLKIEDWANEWTG